MYNRHEMLIGMVSIDPWRRMALKFKYNMRTAGGENFSLKDN